MERVLHTISFSSCSTACNWSILGLPLRLAAVHPLSLSIFPVVPFPHHHLLADLYHEIMIWTELSRPHPDDLLHALSRPLKKLTWTNYEYDGSDFAQGVQFYQDAVGPRLAGVGGELEF